ncbi:HAMP domain-containing protein [Propionivibrio limicola]|uniref:HAMP domain-containing protein n=1 Tax=Propionivibrio limicola TaxID=167645 RepID=UPI001291AD16|nr:HAMP domain-containing protein [Propionivibrio limicola]
MRILEPIVKVVGRLSFRSKLRITALVFGVPLLVAAGILVYELNARVSVLERERAALAAQLPAHAVLAGLYQLQAAKEAELEGAAELGGVVKSWQDDTRKALRNLQFVFEKHGLTVAPVSKETPAGFGHWNVLAGVIETADPVQVSETLVALRQDLERINEQNGLLIDGDASTSRLLAAMTGHYASLVKTTGQTAVLGGVTLVKKSLRGSRRSELTMRRGNFDSLVSWSMEALQKVGQERPALAANLDEAGSRLNTAYAPVQEALTTKILDTQDYDMAPGTFLALTEAAFRQTQAAGALIEKSADSLLADRLAALQLQRNAVLLAMAAVLALVVASFVAAYISIMRAVNGLSDAVTTMASGDLDARVDVTTRDELGTVGKQFNRMAQNLAERTAQLREKTNDINTMLQNMPQGILTIVEGGWIHAEYSSFLETIFETKEVEGQSAMAFVFGNGSLGADELAQMDVTVDSCLGEDRMNYDFNAHLLAREFCKTMPDGRRKILELAWSPICDENDIVEKIMVCVRDVTELRRLEAEAEQQKRELEMIGQILGVQQEKFNEFVDSARRFVTENEALLREADDSHPELVTRLFRNMHTIKGNARTYGLLHLTNVVHEAEQAYDELRKNEDMAFDKDVLLDQLQDVMEHIEQYASLNDVKLGRKGPGRRGSAEKYLMVPRAQIEEIGAGLDAVDVQAASPEQLATLVQDVRRELRLIGTESMHDVLAGVFTSLPSLAAELGKEAPQLVLNENGLRIRNQVSDLLRNVFMHLYRNSLDHGIEHASERLAKGKPAAGRIELDLALADGRLMLRLRDDGRGLALGHIRRKAMENGLIEGCAASSDEAVANLVFASGFSTASAVTEVSGRGVGMDAVRDFITREGGEIALRFTGGEVGREFRPFETVISLPEKFAVRLPEDAVAGEAVPAQAAPAGSVSPGWRAGQYGLMGAMLSLNGQRATEPKPA